MQIEAVRSITPELVESLARLLPQQSLGARHPTAQQLAAVVEVPTNTLLIARDDRGAIVGTLTLMLLLTPGATFGFVEDVVVDVAARGRGIGEALVSVDGVTWDVAQQFSLHEGGIGPQDTERQWWHTGYPCTTQLADGTLLTVYHAYSQEERPRQYVESVRWTLQD